MGRSTFKQAAVEDMGAEQGNYCRLTFTTRMKNKRFAIGLIIFGLLIGVFLSVLFFKSMRIDPSYITDWQTFGGFGESMGVVAVILAFAAGVLGYETLKTQLEEIKNASDRFSQEQATTNERFEAEQRLARDLNLMSSFQNGFFLLLDRQREIADNLPTGRDNDVHGQQALQKVQRNYIENYKKRRYNNSVEEWLASCRAAETETQVVFPTIRHYYRSLYHLIKYVDNFAAGAVERRAEFDSKQFIDLVQAQMSNWELFLTLVNSFNHKRMFILIRQYNLVENLKIDLKVFEENDAKEVAISYGIKIKDQLLQDQFDPQLLV
jgi:hypothetical protein